MTENNTYHKILNEARLPSTSVLKKVFITFARSCYRECHRFTTKKDM